MKAIPKDFIDGLKICLPTMAQKALRFDLNFLKIDNNQIYASDDARIAKFKLSESFNSTYYLSKEQANFIVSGNYKQYQIEGKKLKLKKRYGEAKLPLPSEAKWPDIDENLFKTNRKKTTIVNCKKEKILDALNRLVPFSSSEESSERVTIFVKKNSIVLEGNNVFGKNTETIRSKNERHKKEISFDFNPLYLSEGINNLSDDKINIRISEQDNMFKIVLKNKNYSFVLASYAI